MNLIIRRPFIFLVFTLSLLFCSTESPQERGFKVTRVYDGDSFKASIYDIEIKVRLVGIDTPEPPRRKHQEGQPYSKQATKYLASLILNKTVDIKGYGLGRYNRVLGVVMVDGENVNMKMIEEGLAEVYTGKHPKGFDSTEYRNAETSARKSKKGMWSLGEKYISPREWRRMHKN